jgi:uncharacterized membrane protein
MTVLVVLFVPVFVGICIGLIVEKRQYDANRREASFWNESDR